MGQPKYVFGKLNQYYQYDPHIGMKMEKVRRIHKVDGSSDVSNDVHARPDWDSNAKMVLPQGFYDPIRRCSDHIDEFIEDTEFPGKGFFIRKKGIVAIQPIDIPDDVSLSDFKKFLHSTYQVKKMDSSNNIIWHLPYEDSRNPKDFSIEYMGEYIQNYTFSGEIVDDDIMGKFSEFKRNPHKK